MYRFVRLAPASTGFAVLAIQLRHLSVRCACTDFYPGIRHGMHKVQASCRECDLLGSCLTIDLHVFVQTGPRALTWGVFLLNWLVNAVCPPLDAAVQPRPLNPVLGRSLCPSENDKINETSHAAVISARHSCSRATLAVRDA